MTTFARISATGFGIFALVVVLACGGVCGDSEDYDEIEEGTGDGIHDKFEGTGDDLEGNPDNAAALTPDSPIATQTLPRSMQTMVTCLGAKSANDLSRVTPSQAKSCLKTHFGNDKGPGRQCGGQPEEVYSSDVLDSCSFTASAAKRGALKKPRPGLGRMHAIFVGDRFQGLMMQSTRPVSNSNASCGTEDLFSSQRQALASQNTGKDHFTRAGLEYKIEHVEMGDFYPVVRDNFILKIEGSTAAPALDATWTRNKATDLPHAGSIPRNMRNAMQEVGDALGCSRYKGSLLGLLGKPLSKITRDCDAIKGGRNWAQWPVSEMRLNEGGNRFQLTAMGPQGIITEVFLRVEAPGNAFVKEMKKNIGRSTPYQCNAHSWYAGKYIIRARPAGKYVNVAFSLVDTHDNLSMVVPGATLGRDWR